MDRLLVSTIVLAVVFAGCSPPKPASVPASSSPPAVVTEPESKAASATPNASSASSAKTEPAAPAPPAKPAIELPRGGRAIFPTYRLVGYCGTPGGPALGRLEGNLAPKLKQIEKYGAEYTARDRKPLPTLELIAVVVQGAPGADKKWRRRVPNSVVDDYLKAARSIKGILLLNIQPGHSSFMEEVKYFEKYLKEPDVGLALDPEWAVTGKQKPGQTFGTTTGMVINEVADYLATIVKEGELPEKVLAFHQVNGHVLTQEEVITAHPGVVIIKSVDGLGFRAAKVKTYNYLVKSMNSAIHAGFKLFFDEDTAGGDRLMTPNEVLNLTPVPEYVMYE